MTIELVARGSPVGTRLYVAMAVIAAATVFVGFSRTYLGWINGGPALTPLVFAHAIVFTSWFLLFAVQAALVSAHRIEIHRKLGIAGSAIALLVVVIGTATGIAAAARGFTPNPNIASPQMFLIKPLGDMALFAGFAGTGLWFRRKPAIHKRLMLVATLTIISPAIVRWPVIGGNGLLAEAVILMFIAACGVNDYLRQRRVHPAFIWGASLIALSIPLRIVIAFTDTWHGIATWLTR